MGGAENLDEVEIFLKNMFNDKYILGLKSDFWRGVLAWVITKSRAKGARANYERLGGKSPLGDITRSLVNKLNVTQDEFKFDYAMNYTPPFAPEVLARYADYDEITLFPLYPHYSQTTIKSSVEAAMNAAASLGIEGKIRVADYFFGDEEFCAIIERSIRAAISNLNNSNLKATNLIFSAHSLPLSIINAGDPYEKHVRAHVELLRKRLADLPFASVSLAYQSRLGPVKWLTPNIAEVLPALEPKRALVYPISFCIDNSETDFELAIYYREIARKLGFEYYEVVRAPDDSDEFAKFILSKVSNLK